MKGIHFSLKAFICTITLLLASETVSAQSCFSNWQYEAPIVISNGNAAVLNDHQVNLTVNTQSLISSGKMNMDGSDIRFTMGCCDTLCYWIEDSINTATTSIWVKVNEIPASGDTTIYMLYGNTSATAQSDGNCTFDLFEDFESGSQASFTAECGTTNETFSNGEMTLDWTGSGMYVSNDVFPVNTTYTVEADVTGITGSWPGLYWFRDSDSKGYGLMANSSDARISVSGGSTGYCVGHNWASNLLPFSNPSGIWSHTWIATGVIISDFPSIGLLASNDVLYAKDADLRLAFGGISSGTGSIGMDWIRVRKHAEFEPTSVIQSEIPYSIASASFTSSSTDLQVDFTNTSTGAQTSAWDFGDGSNSTDTDPTYTYSAVGFYNVCLTVTDSHGCQSEACDSIQITMTGVDELNMLGIKVYPNPASDVVTIESTQTNLISYALIDLSGKVVKKGDATEGTITLNVEALKDGIYTISITTENGILSRKLVLK